MKKFYKVAGFLARAHGLNGLVTFINSEKYKVVCVFTHKLKPKSEDKMRRQREDFVNYKVVCEKYKIPLYTVDCKKEEPYIDEILNEIGHLIL